MGLLEIDNKSPPPPIPPRTANGFGYVDYEIYISQFPVMILKTINITLYTYVGKPGGKKIIIRYLDQLQVHTRPFLSYLYSWSLLSKIM